jgi:hypothetical protein
LGAGVARSNHASRKIVKHGVPERHQESSAGVLAQHLLKNVRNAVIQTHPNFHRNKPNGRHSWQLVFVADGIN